MRGSPPARINVALEFGESGPDGDELPSLVAVMQVGWEREGLYVTRVAGEEEQGASEGGSQGWMGTSCHRWWP